MNETIKKSQKFQILVYGIDRLGIVIPSEKISGKGFELHFEEFASKEEFDNFDGVILPSGIWKGVGRSPDVNDERKLLKRIKQVQKLLKRKGFICFLVGPLDHDTFDLSTKVLGWFEYLYFGKIQPQSFLTIYRDEFKKYLDNYGTAQTVFNNNNEIIDYKSICSPVGGYKEAGIIINGQIFFLPCLEPDKDESSTTKLFSLTAESLVNSFRKLRQEIPQWARQFEFYKEKGLKEKRAILQSKIEKVDSQLNPYTDFKQCLCFGDDRLVESVEKVLKLGFYYNVETSKAHIEDLKIKKKIGKEVKTIALIEVKGKTGNIAREDINQVDSHRERLDLQDDFPGILIVNTFLKATSIKDKEKTINKEQIKHAVKMKVLIMRTIDLLNVLNLIEKKKLTSSDFLKILLKDKGWLKVDSKGHKIIKE